MNKKGNALGAVAIILAMVILGIFLITIAQRDCNSNRDCSDNSYCGSDHECHQYPDKIIVEEHNFLFPAFVLGVSLIISAYIMKKSCK
jgi:hypothetical protein